VEVRVYDGKSEPRRGGGCANDAQLYAALRIEPFDGRPPPRKRGAWEARNAKIKLTRNKLETEGTRQSR